jgi:membrane protein DedA with SNARE-associated domain
MGRAYAGTLGPLAFALTIARGVAASSGVEGTILAASAAMLLFATIGYLIGQTAGYLVNESVRSQFQAAMAAWDEKHQQQAKTQPKPIT